MRCSVKRLEELRPEIDAIYERMGGLGLCTPEKRQEMFDGLLAELKVKMDEAASLRDLLKSLPNPQP